MQIVTLLNEKGGVGKTTLAVHIAAGLAIRDRRVVLLDLDSQGHSTLTLGLPRQEGVYRLLVGDEEWPQVLRVPEKGLWAGENVTEGRLFVLPSDPMTREIARRVSNPLLLRERLDELAGIIDVVVIDTSPAISDLHILAHMATDLLLMPTELSYLSLVQVGDTVKRAVRGDELRQKLGLDKLKWLAVQPTKYKPRTLAQQTGLEQVQERFDAQNVWTPLHNLTVWEQCSGSQQTLFSRDPDHVATHQAWNLIDRVQAVIG
jgi:chromosome partitioning protein